MEDRQAGAGTSPLSTSAVDVSLFPYASWAKLYKEVVYNSPELLQRGDPRGEAPLREALARLLSDWLRSLPREDRVLFLRRYWYGVSVKELAVEADCTENQMAQRMRKLRQALRAVLEQEGIAI